MVGLGCSLPRLRLDQEIFSEAQDLMPGGVSSPVRAFKSVGGNPIVFDKVKGAKAWDVDGNEHLGMKSEFFCSQHVYTNNV